MLFRGVRHGKESPEADSPGPPGLFSPNLIPLVPVVCSPPSLSLVHGPQFPSLLPPLSLLSRPQFPLQPTNFSLNQSITVSNRSLPVFSLYFPHFPPPISPIPAPILDSRLGCSVSRSTRPWRPKSTRATPSSPKRQPGCLGGPIWTPSIAVQGEHDALRFPSAPTLRRRL
jgi:hypothetical protein